MKQATTKKQQTLASIVDYHLTSLEADIASSKEKLDANFLYNFEWGYPAQLFADMLKKQELTQFREYITMYMFKDKVQDFLEHHIKQITQELLGGNYLGTSSSQFHNIAHTLKKEVKADLLSSYKQYLERITEYDMPIL